MVSYLIRRLWQMIPTLLGVLLLVFFLFNWVGGDPAYVLAGKISNPEQIANIRRQLGIDETHVCAALDISETDALFRFRQQLEYR